LEEGNFLERAS